MWYTYFVVTSDRNRVKIGRSRNPTKRINSVQNQSGQALTVVLLLPGDHEKEFHRRFAIHRLKGEWFIYAPSIKQFVLENHGALPARRIGFHEWLEEQRERPDTVGLFALLVHNEPNLFPRSSKLCRLLDACGENHSLRHAVKTAHWHWRRAA